MTFSTLPPISIMDVRILKEPEEDGKLRGAGLGEERELSDMHSQ